MPLTAVSATKLGKGGRIVIPSAYRKALKLREGDELILKLEDGEVRMYTRLQALRRAQRLVLRTATKGQGSVVDELIRERREDAQRE